MPEDIVERLRKADCKDGFAVILYQYMEVAADEIERLRAEIDRQRSTLELQHIAICGYQEVIDELRAYVAVTREPPHPQAFS